MRDACSGSEPIRDRRRFAAALALGCAVACDRAPADRAVVARLAVREAGGHLDGTDLDWAFGRAAPREFYPQLASIDGRSEWRYFVLSDELGSRGLSGLENLTAVRDAARRQLDRSTLLVPPGAGAIFHLPATPGEHWLVEADAWFDAESFLTLYLVFFTDDAPALAPHVVPGELRARLRTHGLGLLPLARTNDEMLARLEIEVPATARSAAFLAVAEGQAKERIDRIEGIRVYRSDELVRVAASGVIETDGRTRAEFAGAMLPALAVPSGAAFEFELTEVPPSAELVFTPRLLARAAAAWSVEIARADAVVELARGDGAATGDAIEMRVDLAAFAGSRSTLRWRCHAAPRSALAYFGAPRVVATAPRAAPSPTIVLLEIEGLEASALAQSRVPSQSPNLSVTAARGARFTATAGAEVNEVAAEYAALGYETMSFGPLGPDEFAAARDCGAFDLIDLRDLATDRSAPPGPSLAPPAPAFGAALERLRAAGAPPAFVRLRVPRTTPLGVADRLVSDLVRELLDREVLARTQLVVAGATKPGATVPAARIAPDEIPGAVDPRATTLGGLLRGARATGKE